MTDSYSEVKTAIDLVFDDFRKSLREKFPHLPDAAINFAATQMTILVTADLGATIDREQFMAVLNRACAICSDN